MFHNFLLFLQKLRTSEYQIFESTKRILNHINLKRRLMKQEEDEDERVMN